jgi:carbamoyltransferase
MKADTYETYPEYHTPCWRGPVERRFSRHRLHLFDHWYDAYAVDHHLAHVAGALFTSPFEKAGLLTADGSGDHRTCALACGDGNRITEIEYGWGHEGPGRLQLNIGRTWASIGEYNFGMQRLEGAGKLMGLASYGTVRKEILPTLQQQMLYHPFSPYPKTHPDSLKRFNSSLKVHLLRMSAPRCRRSQRNTTWKRPPGSKTCMV